MPINPLRGKAPAAAAQPETENRHQEDRTFDVYHQLLQGRGSFGEVCPCPRPRMAFKDFGPSIRRLNTALVQAAKHCQLSKTIALHTQLAALYLQNIEPELAIDSLLKAANTCILLKDFKQADKLCNHALNLTKSRFLTPQFIENTYLHAVRMFTQASLKYAGSTDKEDRKKFQECFEIAKNFGKKSSDNGFDISEKTIEDILSNRDSLLLPAQSYFPDTSHGRTDRLQTVLIRKKLQQFRDIYSMLVQRFLTPAEYSQETFDKFLDNTENFLESLTENSAETLHQKLIRQGQVGFNIATHTDRAGHAIHAIIETIQGTNSVRVIFCDTNGSNVCSEGNCVYSEGGKPRVRYNSMIIPAARSLDLIQNLYHHASGSSLEGKEFHEKELRAYLSSIMVREEPVIIDGLRKRTQKGGTCASASFRMMMKHFIYREAKSPQEAKVLYGLFKIFNLYIENDKLLEVTSRQLESIQKTDTKLKLQETKEIQIQQGKVLKKIEEEHSKIADKPCSGKEIASLCRDAKIQAIVNVIKTNFKELRDHPKAHEVLTQLFNEAEPCAEDNTYLVDIITHALMDRSEDFRVRRRFIQAIDKAHPEIALKDFFTLHKEVPISKL